MTVRIPRPDGSVYTESSGCRQTICYAVRRAYSRTTREEIYASGSVEVDFLQTTVYHAVPLAMENLARLQSTYNANLRDVRGIVFPFFRLFFEGKTPTLAQHVGIKRGTWSSGVTRKLTVSFPAETVMLNPMLLHMALGLFRHAMYLSGFKVPKYNHNVCSVERYIQHLTDVRNLSVRINHVNPASSPIMNARGRAKVVSLLTRHNPSKIKRDAWGPARGYSPLPWFESQRMSTLVKR